MGRTSPAVVVVSAVAVLSIGLAWVLETDPLLQLVETRLTGGKGSNRPVEALVRPLPPRSDIPPLNRVVVSAHLRERPASYDLSLLPDNISEIRSMDPQGPASWRPRGVGVASPSQRAERARGPSRRGAPVIGGSDDMLFEDPNGGAAPAAGPQRGSTGVTGQVVEVFESTDINHNQINTGGLLFIPPDTHDAAGPNHLVSVTNVTLRIHQKNGNLIYDSSLRDFFAPLSPPTYTFDPRVIYDQFAQRFIVTTAEITDVQFNFPSDTATLYIAVSDDDDPAGTWYQTALNVQLSFFNEQLGYTTHHWLDFPGLAVDEEAVYIHGRAVSNFSNSALTGGYRLFVLDKQLGTGGLYDGGAVSAAVYDPFAGGSGIGVTSQPAHIFGSPGAGVGTYLVGYSGLSDGTNEFLQVVQVDDPLGSISFTPQFVSLGDIDDFTAPLPDATQLGTSTRIDTTARPTLNAVWRNNTLWTATNVAGRGADAGQVSAHWYEMTTQASGVVTLADQGSISGNDIGAGTFTFFPSIAVNDRDQAVIGFSASGPSIYPSAYAAVRLPGDPPGTTGPSLLVRAGVDFYIRTLSGSINRWGDYGGAAVDPVDQCFWVHNQYAKLRGTFVNNEGGRWATAFARICAFDCGNGTPEAPEECDDGNTIDGDTCSNACEINACGPVDTDGDTFGDGCDADDDNDGVFDTDDCAPLDATVSANPVEVGNVMLDSGSTEIVWSTQAGAVYDVAFGLLSDLRAEMGTTSATCLINDSAVAQAVDNQPDPPVGEGCYYIVRSQNACGAGSYGTATGGAPRLPAAACP